MICSLFGFFIRNYFIYLLINLKTRIEELWKRLYCAIKGNQHKMAWTAVMLMLFLCSVILQSPQKAIVWRFILDYFCILCNEFHMPFYQCKQHIALRWASSAPTQMLHAVSVILSSCWVTPTIKTVTVRVSEKAVRCICMVWCNHSSDSGHGQSWWTCFHNVISLIISLSATTVGSVAHSAALVDPLIRMSFKFLLVIFLWGLIQKI